MARAVTAQWWGAQLRAVQRDFIGFLEQGAQESGDVYAIRPTPFNKIWVVNHPQLVQDVLVGRAGEFSKSKQTHMMVGKYLGQGLVLAEGDAHRTQRRRVQPAFGPGALLAAAPQIVARAAAVGDATVQGSGVFDVLPAMTALSLEVILDFLVGGEPEAVQREALTAFGDLAAAISERFKALPLPAWLPTERNRRDRRAIKAVARLVERLATTAEGTGIVAMLAKAVRNGEIPASELHDQIVTLLFAGHETVAKVLTWTLYLLAGHPGVQQKVHAELADVVGARAVEAADFGRLKYLQAVLKESMRLYPPAWVFDRSAKQQLELGGKTIMPRDTIYVSPYLLHRNAAHFAAPERFLPERFEGGRDADLAAGTYIPFGAGPRSCVGQAFAQLESGLVLATLLQRLAVSRAEDRPVKAMPLATLTPERPVLLKVTPAVSSSPR